VGEEGGGGCWGGEAVMGEDFGVGLSMMEDDNGEGGGSLGSIEAWVVYAP